MVRGKITIVNKSDQFDWYEGGRGARAYATCSLTRSGSMTLNAQAYEELGRPKAIRLGWDGGNRILAIRSVDPDQPGSLVLRQSKTVSGELSGSYSFFARAALAYYGIFPSENHRYKLARLDFGIMTLEIDKPLPKTRSGTRRARTEESGDE